jgi:hypothetical protein
VKKQEEEEAGGLLPAQHGCWMAEDQSLGAACDSAVLWNCYDFTEHQEEEDRFPIELSPTTLIYTEPKTFILHLDIFSTDRGIISSWGD